MSREYCSIVPATTLTGASTASSDVPILRETFEGKECRTGHENRGSKIAGLVAEQTIEPRSVAIGSSLQALDTSSPTVEPRCRLLPGCADQALSLPSIWSCIAEKEGASPGSATAPAARRRSGNRRKHHLRGAYRYGNTSPPVWDRTNLRLVQSVLARS